MCSNGEHIFSTHLVLRWTSLLDFLSGSDDTGCSEHRIIVSRCCCPAGLELSCRVAQAGHQHHGQQRWLPLVPRATAARAEGGSHSEHLHKGGLRLQQGNHGIACVQHE